MNQFIILYNLKKTPPGIIPADDGIQNRIYALITRAFL